MNDPQGAKCKELIPILKEIEKGFDITFDFVSESYTITHNGSYFQRVPYGQFDRNLVAEIRRSVWLNTNGNVIDEIEKNNSRIDASMDRAQSLYAESLAKDLRRPLINDYLYGG